MKPKRPIDGASARLIRHLGRPIIVTPYGIPDGWCIYVDDGVPTLTRRDRPIAFTNPTRPS